MSVSDKVKALLALCGKRNIDAANYFGMSAQSFNNKLSRGSFSSDDLIKLCRFLNVRLCFETKGNQKIYLDDAAEE